MIINNSFKSILLLEINKNYTNTAVIGGIDKFLKLNGESIRLSIKNRQLLVEFNQLNIFHINYADKNLQERTRWVQDVLTWLDRYDKYNEQDVLEPTKSNFGYVSTGKDTHLQRKEPLDSPVTIIKGIAPRISSKLAKLEIRTILDLLYFVPRYYVDYSLIKPIVELQSDQYQTIIARITLSHVVPLGNRKGTEIKVQDKTGTMRIVWFNQPYLTKKLLAGKTIAVSGRPTFFRGNLVFVSPEWELLEESQLVNTGRLLPVYSLTSGIYPKQLRKWIKDVIDGWLWQISDFLPESIIRRCQLMELTDAIAGIHYPNDSITANNARKRLAFDELFLLQLALLSKKRRWQNDKPGYQFMVSDRYVEMFLSHLPYSLTRAQKRVLDEVTIDTAKGKPMLRLLQGEVGSGKTVIAIYTLLLAIINGYQAAFMAPTEVLAKQHYGSLCAFLSKIGSIETEAENPYISHYQFFNSDITVALLVGSLTEEAKSDIHERIKQGELLIVVGTHSLIQKKVRFKNLGMVVVDEQQRFGVLQRSYLRQKGYNPHVLVMTATPIPRTMALTLYGDLDLSVLDELPPGRQTNKTICFESKDIAKAYSFIRKQVAQSKQAFIICPLIEESEVLESKAAVEEYNYLSKHVFFDLSLGLLHGRIHSDEKDRIMTQFNAGDIDILVATSVIEVGIDIPNATVILIEGANRFGLSQLHQLRGRVGRGADQGYCILVSEKSLVEESRLRLMEEYTDGYKLAEEDLKIRGPGDLFGTLQSGFLPLKVARFSDRVILEQARQEAIRLFEDDPNLSYSGSIALKEKLHSFWPQETEWS